LIEILHGKLNTATSIKIFSAQGQQVLETIAKAGTDKTKVNIAALSKGVYFIKMVDYSAQKMMFIKE